MRILAINASSDFLTVGVVTEKEVFFEIFSGERSVHSSAINAAVNKAMASARTDFADLDAYAVCVGPGSFTGIRVGIATIKGYRFAVHKPVICVNSLSIVAYNVKGECEVTMDAGRGRVYFGVFNSGAECEKPVMLDSEPQTSERIRIAYDSGKDYAYDFASLVREKYVKGEFSESISPMYLQLCQAEEEHSKKVSGPEIRYVTLADVADIAVVEKDFFGAEAWSEEVIKATVTSNNSEFYGAYEGNTLLGYNCYELAIDEAYMGNMAVKSVFRRKGIASLLLKNGEERLKERGFHTIILDVRVSNEAAIALYKKNGYSIICRRKNFYCDEDGFTMVKDL